MPTHRVAYCSCCTVSPIGLLCRPYTNPLGGCCGGYRVPSPRRLILQDTDQLLWP